MTESGKIVKFKAPVTLANGTKTDLEVARIGAFNLIADGKYLRFVPETQKNC